jgi:hypothetical protein
VARKVVTRIAPKVVGLSGAEAGNVLKGRPRGRPRPDWMG